MQGIVIGQFGSCKMQVERINAFLSMDNQSFNLPIAENYILNFSNLFLIQQKMIILTKAQKLKKKMFIIKNE